MSNIHVDIGPHDQLFHVTDGSKFDFSVTDMLVKAHRTTDFNSADVNHHCEASTLGEKKKTFRRKINFNNMSSGRLIGLALTA